MASCQNREVNAMPALASRETLAVLAYGHDVERVTIRLESCERNVGGARRFARRHLVRWGLSEQDELADRVLLVVSELVTNAVVHGRVQRRADSETVEVTLALKRNFALGIKVSDSSCDIPRMDIRPSVSSINGRGLALVKAESDGWITDRRRDNEGAGGKSVWAFFEYPQLIAAPQPA
ncbi:ATP-binding protein [Streptomyces sp. NPDC059783]|uniref:ATP-binding protein n=1 Tax=Streptomyces sp. NPDC059783 TaxID=3346944 RepID=UPI0036635D54